ESILNRTVFQNDSYSRLLSQRISNYMLGLPEDAYEQFIEEVRHITPDDIHRVANKYLHPNALQVVVVGNRALVEDQLDEIGSFKELDIRIPRPGESVERPQVIGDEAGGRTWLNKMSSAIISEDIQVNAFITEGSQTVETMQGPMEMGVTRIIVSSDDIRLDIRTAMGAIQMVIEGDSGKMVAGGQEQPLPSDNVESMKLETLRDPIMIAQGKEVLPVTLVEQDKEQAVLYIGGETDAYVVIDKETALPVQINYTQFDEASGSDLDLEVHLSDWTEHEGITYPYSVNVSSDGETISSITYTRHYSK
ncbi:hypothetical protein QLX67_11170, partial [Balneolaceae bacterium ANBcel3]|nr:hypothetical protein [Balneolaceae bacterium ANBcel3]